MISLSCGIVSGPKMLRGGLLNVTRQYAGDRRVRRNCLVGASDATAVCFPGKDFVVAVFLSRKKNTGAIVLGGVFFLTPKAPNFNIKFVTILSPVCHIMSTFSSKT